MHNERFAFTHLHPILLLAGLAAGPGKEVLLAGIAGERGLLSRGRHRVGVSPLTKAPFWEQQAGSDGNAWLAAISTLVRAAVLSENSLATYIILAPVTRILILLGGASFYKL